MSKPLMAKATAVWLVGPTPTLSFKQIARFLRPATELEVQGIADRRRRRWCEGL